LDFAINSRVSKNENIIINELKQGIIYFHTKKNEDNSGTTTFCFCVLS